MTKLGFEISDRRHALNHEGNDLFATFEISKPEDTAGTFTNLVGLRNSHIKHFSATAVVGGRVFVCDNLMISGDIEMKRRHVGNILNDLPNELDDMMSQLAGKWLDNEIRYDAYADTALDKEQVHHLIMQGFRYEAIASSKISKVVNYWDEPPHEEFEPRNAWSLFNAFTEVHKETPSMLMPRSKRLHNAFDEYCRPQINKVCEERGVPYLDAEDKTDSETEVTNEKPMPCPYKAYDESDHFEMMHPDQTEFTIE